MHPHRSPKTTQRCRSQILAGLSAILMASAVIPAASAGVAQDTAPITTAPVAPATSTHAGDRIVMTTTNGDQGLCTLNSVVERNGVFYGITAGHCLAPGEDGATPVKITTNDGALLADASDLQDSAYLMDGEASPFNPTAGLNDFAWFKLHNTVRPDLTGISSTADTGIDWLDPLLTGHRIETGDPVPVTNNLVGGLVCKDGAMTGRTCGPVLSVNTETQEIFAAIPAIAGDSGSPLYVLGPDLKIHIIGALSNGTPVLFNIFDGTHSHLPTVGTK